VLVLDVASATVCAYWCVVLMLSNVSREELLCPWGHYAVFSIISLWLLSFDNVLNPAISALIILRFGHLYKTGNNKTLEQRIEKLSSSSNADNDELCDFGEINKLLTATAPSIEN
jgi:hypothetical protein